jgi:hypothetical protein
MLLEELLKQPQDSSKLVLHRQPYGKRNHEQLIREVMGLANANVYGARYIVFGVDQQAGVIGLSESAVGELKSDNRLAARFIEPALEMAPIFAEVDGKRVAILEIDGCDDPPYVVREDISAGLRRGACWVREGQTFRPAQRTDLDRMYAAKDGAGEPPVHVGLNGDPLCSVLELRVPDTTCPPSRKALQKIKQAIEAKKSTRAVYGKDDTAMARLVHARLYGAHAPFERRGLDTLVRGIKTAGEDHRDADRYYFFEEHALRLNLAVSNRGRETLERVKLVISLPRVPGFDVAPRVYSPPGETPSKHESDLMGYPRVKRSRDSIQVRCTIGTIEPDESTAAFGSPLRMAVGAAMKSQKIGLRYTLAAKNLDGPIHGRLKLKFNP